MLKFWYIIRVHVLLCGIPDSFKQIVVLCAAAQAGFAGDVHVELDRIGVTGLRRPHKSVGHKHFLGQHLRRDAQFFQAVLLALIGNREAGIQLKKVSHHLPFTAFLLTGFTTSRADSVSLFFAAFGQRNEVLDGADVHSKIQNMISESAKTVVTRYLALEANKEKWNLEGLKDYYLNWVLDNNSLNFSEEELKSQSIDSISNFITQKCNEKFQFLSEMYGDDSIRDIERAVLLQVVDKHWMDHMDAMEELKRGIGLRAYAQKDPVIDYRMEGFDMFDAMISDIKEETVRTLLSIQTAVNNVPDSNFKSLDEEFADITPFFEQLEERISQSQGVSAV